MLKYSLGIDLSMETFHACLSVIDFNQQVKVKASRKFSNTVTGFKELCQWIEKHYKQRDIPLIIAMEATEVYYESCALYLVRANYKVAVILPNKPKSICKPLVLRLKPIK